MLIRQFPAPLDTLFEWQTGDHITHLDGRPIEDILDLYYYTPESKVTTLNIQRKTGETLRVELDPGDIDLVTDCFAPMEFKTCACDCVSEPRGDARSDLRQGRGLPFQLSLRQLHHPDQPGQTGPQKNHRAGDEPALRIGSRHGYRRAHPHAGHQTHQVVLCPGWNEGPILEKTFRDLLTLGAPVTEEESPFTAVCERGHGYDGAGEIPEYDGADETGRGGIKSLAIVPVGLSAHREGLTKLESVGPDLAAETIAQVATWQEDAKKELGYSFVYLSDEFYLMAEQPFPPAVQYDDFWQIDNAIGLSVRLRDTWREELEWRAEDGELPMRPLTVLTGHLAAKAWLREFTPVLTGANTPNIEVVGVDNRFYGNSVTVAGLLGGQDLRRALLELPAEPKRTVVLSQRVINSDGLTLDGLTIEDIAQDQPHEVVVGEEDGFIDFWRELG